MKRRIWCILLTLCLVTTLLPTAARAANVLYAGTCGENATWVITDDGVMTISGTGTVTAPMTKQEASHRMSGISTLVVEEGITEIGDEAFGMNYQFTTVRFPDSLKTIGREAFMNMTSLCRIEFGSGLTAIKGNAFAECRNLKEMELPERLQEIGHSAFIDCFSLTEVVIPGSVKTIRSYAFAGCRGMQSAIIRDGVAALEEGAFRDCGLLEEIYVPDTVRALGVGCFWGCYSLDIFRVPAYVTEIPLGCFAACGSLQAIIVPGTVTKIDRDAFKYSTNLRAFFYTGTEDMLKNIQIEEIGNEPLANVSVYLLRSMPDPVFGFFDMPEQDNWAYPGIAFCLYTGLMNGVGNGYFQPNGTTTRAQLVTILWRLMGEPKASQPAPFTDLTQDWYREAVAWAAENNITNGTSAATFSPDAPITREQMVTIFYRMCRDYLKMDVSPAASLAGFPDSSTVSAWAKDAIQWAVAVKLISGVGDGRGNSYLQPQGSATRAQIATVMMNFVNAFADETEDETASSRTA